MIVIISQNTILENTLKHIPLFNVSIFITTQKTYDCKITPALLILDNDSTKNINTENFYSNIPETISQITISSTLPADIIKPFYIRDLIQLIELKYRTNIYNISGNIFNPRTRIISNKNGKILRLTEKESNLIEYLLSNQQSAVSKKKLLQIIWGYHADLETTTVETHIYRLRQKLADINLADLIQTSKKLYFINSTTTIACTDAGLKL